MKRLLALIVSSLSLLSTSAYAAPRTAPRVAPQGLEVRACWMTQYAYLGMTETQLRDAAQEMIAGGLNTVYFNVYGGGGQTFWPSKAFVEAGGVPAAATFDQTRYLVEVFKEEGLRVGAWFEYGLALSSINHPIAVAHPDWLARDSGGSPVTGENNGFVFLSPGHADVKALMVDMVTELAENYAFDDIQLDRFRWGRRNSGREYGYEAVSADAYEALYGTAPPSNVNNFTWVAFREGLVNEVVEACYDAIKAANDNIVVSSAPTGSYGITQHMQRWSTWLNGGYMDLVMPQMYLPSLSSFQTEFNTQRALAGANVDKLGVGYRAQGASDWTLVRDQLEYARGQGVPHAALWVYHFYTSVPAIRDELLNLPLPGRPWEQPAVNPFAPECNEQFFVDDDDAAGYVESGPGWIDSAQGDFFAFGSRVVPGVVSGPDPSAEFRAVMPRTGPYEVFVWYTSAANRNPAARYTVADSSGSTEVFLDQRSGTGGWIKIGEFHFAEGPSLTRVTVDTNQATTVQFTSADAVRFRLLDCPAAPLEAFCYGDGGVAPGCTPCPCGNDAPSGSLGGCLNSGGTSASLIVYGSPSAASDTMRFEVYGATPSSFGMLVSADNKLPNSSSSPCFGFDTGITGSSLDGLRCVGGAFLRHGTRPSDSLGEIGPSTNGWGPPSGPAGGLIASSGFVAGQTRNYQVFYREDVQAQCGSGQATTNAVSATFLP